MRDWKYVPKRQRRACVTLIVCILFFLASASATVLLLILDARSANPVLPQVMAELTGKAEPEVQQRSSPAARCQRAQMRARPIWMKRFS